MNIIIRLVGLTPRFFMRPPWDCLSILLLSSGLSTSFLHLFSPQNPVNNYINRIFQPAIALLVIPYISTFQNLLNIALASIPLVTTLLTTWGVLLLFFAIAFTQSFGLTRFNTRETGNVNFRSIPKANILLFRMTLGEGRSGLMEDFVSINPPYCTPGSRYFDGDCGDRVFAQVLFTTWKVLSTYLFTSLFISLVFDSFSHVY